MTLFKHIVDEKTSLALIEDEDSAEIFALTDGSRSHLRPWLPWVDNTKSIDDTKEFVSSAIKQYANKDGFHCCIRYDEHIAGIIGYHRIDWPNKTTELGYWLANQFEAKGIMTNCCRVLTEYAFIGLKLNRVEIRAADVNVRSCAIPQRLGFTYEGTLRNAEWVNDRYLHNVVYSMLKVEWGNNDAV